MDDETAASSNTPAANGPDAHGQAALLLAESLLHGLVARALISPREAIEIVEIAADVQHEIGQQGAKANGNGNPAPSILLATIINSLRSEDGAR